MSTWVPSPHLDNWFCNEYIFLSKTDVKKNCQTLENKTKHGCLPFQHLLEHDFNRSNWEILQGIMPFFLDILFYYWLGLKLYLLYFCLREMRIISSGNYSSKVIDLLPYRTLTNFGFNLTIIFQHSFFSSYKYSAWSNAVWTDFIILLVLSLVN